MAATNWKAPQTAVNVDRDGKADWGDVNNAKDDDEDFATVLVGKPDYADWLRLTNFGFDAAEPNGIPAGATINGIEVQYKRRGSYANAINDSVVKLRKASDQVGDNKASATYWATTKETVTYPATGGSTDTWNSGLTASDIRDSGFGIDLSPYNNYYDVYRNADIYYCQIRVYYTEAVEIVPFRNYYPHILAH